VTKCEQDSPSQWSIPIVDRERLTSLPPPISQFPFLTSITLAAAPPAFYLLTENTHYNNPSQKFKIINNQQAH